MPVYWFEKDELPSFLFASDNLSHDNIIRAHNNNKCSLNKAPLLAGAILRHCTTR